MEPIKVAILAGGLGTRLAEETSVRPKPMVEIGGRPILWHIMSIYATWNYRDFLVACGYRGEFIKNYFLDYRLVQSDWQLNLATGDMEVVGGEMPDWRVGLYDTGLHTMTAGRLLRLRSQLRSTFMVTYGDGVADVQIERLIEQHRAGGRLATITAVHPPARFGSLRLDGDRVAEFSEKVATREGWINGGFFVFEPEVLDYIDGDSSSLESETLVRLAADGQLGAYRHDGFWHPMDTIRDRQLLESLWAEGKAPWKVWR